MPVDLAPVQLATLLREVDGETRELLRDKPGGRARAGDARRRRCRACTPTRRS